MLTIIDTESVGFYKGDGLAVIRQKSKCNICKINNQITKKLSDIGFNITINAGETSTNFSDIQLNFLTDYLHQTKCKTIYNNKDSNLPWKIKKNNLKMIEK